MCGRFTLVTNLEKWKERFQIEVIPFDAKPRYNIAPGQFIPAIIADRGERRMGQLRWGLVPSWAADEKSSYKMINARCETLNEKPAFKQLFARKRCILPADSFYEWMNAITGKQPMRIMMKTGEPFAFAGLYDTWMNQEGEKVHTCTIVTTKANELIENIHERMPVILKKEDEDLWLDREKYDRLQLQSLFTPYDSSEMMVYPVSTKVGSPKNDDPSCIQEVEIDSLFEDESFRRT
ncbi:SOS response-associated peptidase [Brevibacillus brevis]|uniref:Abasic site processing protein n=1 Tax=Brevibacillus brevis TaxID=1393 RepID=A0A2Z4MJY2_BREBE|nr:SOS response-associated peptidase [Brevibacillus brevis]AWX56689.1 SOS response-associated peptidase [Brevibacillus brevis]